MKLAVSRDGSKLASLCDGRLCLLDLTGKASAMTASVAEASDLVLFDQELWVVVGAMIRRYTLELRETAAASVPAGHDLIRVPYGGPAALWLPVGSARPMLITRNQGAFAMMALEFEYRAGDLLVPLSEQRFLRGIDRGLTLLDISGAIRWRHDAGAPAIAFGPVLEGRSVAAVVGRGGGHQRLVVLDQRDGTCNAA